MSLMNLFEHKQSGLLVSDPLRRRQDRVEAPESSQQAECTCPDLCCIDHDN
jgi:hypothetical protein